MVAIGGRESGYNPEAHRTNTDPAKMVGDFGLFQINYVNDTQTTPRRDRNHRHRPVARARDERSSGVLPVRAGGLDPWTAAAGGWTGGRRSHVRDGSRRGPGRSRTGGGGRANRLDAGRLRRTGRRRLRYGAGPARRHTPRCRRGRQSRLFPIRWRRRRRMSIRSIPMSTCCRITMRSSTGWIRTRLTLMVMGSPTAMS